jgi:hypothetical protein
MLTGCSIVPETKELSLEQLKWVFEQPISVHVKLGQRQASTFLKWCVHPRQPLQIPRLDLPSSDEELRQVSGNSQLEGMNRAHHPEQ